ncbi:hypothetical protein A2U01_0097624, partial [Trifolium medium]|nr:hypothetical protein [Trifolium medium]
VSERRTETKKKNGDEEDER